MTLASVGQYITNKYDGLVDFASTNTVDVRGRFGLNNEGDPTWKKAVKVFAAFIASLVLFIPSVCVKAFSWAKTNIWGECKREVKPQAPPKEA